MIRVFVSSCRKVSESIFLVLFLLGSLGGCVGQAQDGDLLVSTQTAAIGNPGGVSTNLNLWLKAGEGVNNPSNVTVWANQATGGVNNATATTGPAVQDNEINFNPALKWTAGNNEDMGIPGGYLNGTAGDWQLIMVSKVTSGSSALIQTPLDNGDDMRLVHGSSGSRVLMFFSGLIISGPATSVGDVDVVTYNFSNGSVPFGKPANLLVDGSVVADSSTNPGPIGPAAGEAEINRAFATSSSDATVAEYVFYEGQLDAAQLQRVHSYLTIKYGTTMAIDYLDSGSTPIYATTGANSGYGSNIAGIGRDDASGLDQRVSRSEDTGNIVTVALNNDFSSSNGDAARTTQADDRDFVLWGNDSGALTFTGSMNPTANAGIRLVRVWKLQKTDADTSGSVDNVFVQFEDSAFVSGKLHCLVASDIGDFTSGTTQQVGCQTASGSNTLSFAWDTSSIAGPFFSLGITTCGDGVLDSGEVCDDGNTVSGDGCSGDCTFIDNLANGTACTQNAECASTVCDTASDNVCEVALTCGNGATETGEVCDDGNTTSGDGCAADCTFLDNLSNGTACTQNAECASTVCDTVGDNVCEAALTCGNGTVETGEVCDDGNTTAGDGCAADCTFLDNLANGVACTQNAECASSICDTANDNVCEAALTCGNGTVETGEVCDDGNTTAGDGCAADCTFLDNLANGVACTQNAECASSICDTANDNVCEAALTCGNGTVETGEVCDDGNTTAGDGCAADCTFADNLSNGTACTQNAECASTICDTVGDNVCESALTCGNGVVETGEVCDDGNTTVGDGCAADCTFADNLSNGTACTQNAECASSVCDTVGDNVCEAALTCGNGTVETGEVCDDGNTTAGDGCAADCTFADNLSNGTACTQNAECASSVCDTVGDNVCEVALTCGNGAVETGEVCDDGNTTAGDGCAADCTFADNLSNGTACTQNAECASTVCDTVGDNVCEAALTCGNGLVETGEVCDDGNQAAGDGCAADCTVIDNLGNGLTVYW